MPAAVEPAPAVRVNFNPRTNTFAAEMVIRSSVPAPVSTYPDCGLRVGQTILTPASETAMVAVRVSLPPGWQTMVSPTDAAARAFASVAFGCRRLRPSFPSAPFTEST